MLFIDLDLKLVILEFFSVTVILFNYSLLYMLEAVTALENFPGFRE